MWGDPLVLRAFERILAVLIGGIAIWCGYRLFLAVPDQRADGRAELALSKDKRLLITRIGPGTFFALFGTVLVLASFYFGVAGTTNAGNSYSGLGQGSDVGSPASEKAAPAPLPPAPLDPGALRQSLAFLTDAEARLATDGTEEGDWYARRFRAVKLALMARAWQVEWGDPVEFEHWLNETPPRTARPAFERALAVLEARE